MTNFTGRFADSMRWWAEQPEPKPRKQAFYARLCSQYTKEQAILMWDERVEAMKSKGVCNRDKKYTPTYSRLQEDEAIEEYIWINVTYPIEIANIFRKEFVKVIDKLERDIRETDDRDNLKDLYDKLEFAKAEYDLFSFYNPTEWEKQNQTY